jgi:hypothetical protein
MQAAAIMAKQSRNMARKGEAINYIWSKFANDYIIIDFRLDCK